MTQAWFAFRAYTKTLFGYGTATLYGYGTAAEAERYVDHLNVGRETNHYAASALPVGVAIDRGIDVESAGFNLARELMAINGAR